jgi:hypothetical protein
MKTIFLLITVCLFTSQGHAMDLEAYQEIRCEFTSASGSTTLQAGFEPDWESDTNPFNSRVVEIVGRLNDGRLLRVSAKISKQPLFSFGFQVGQAHSELEILSDNVNAVNLMSLDGVSALCTLK